MYNRRNRKPRNPKHVIFFSLFYTSLEKTDKKSQAFLNIFFFLFHFPIIFFCHLSFIFSHQSQALIKAWFFYFLFFLRLSTHMTREAGLHNFSHLKRWKPSPIFVSISSLSFPVMSLMDVLVVTVETFCSSAFCPIHQYSKRNVGLIGLFFLIPLTLFQ